MKVSDVYTQKLKTPIKLQKYEIIKNDDNIPIDRVTEEKEKKAWVIPSQSLTLKRQEFLQGQGLDVKECFQFLMRFEDIDESYKVKYRENIFDIKSIEDIELKRKFILVVAQRVIT